jgi:hypothetical protein
MTKTMRVLGLATALVTGIAGASFAAGGSLGSQKTTETQLNQSGQNQMVPKPANPGAQAVPGTSTYGMSNGNSTTSTYSGAVNSPTTPDAKHPSTATSPTGGGGGNGGSSNGR